MKQKPILRHSRNCTPYPGAKISKLNFTVPNMTLSVREILEKHRQGLHLPQNQFPPVYNAEFIPDFKKLDLVDIDMIKQQNLERQANLQQSIQEHNYSLQNETNELTIVTDFIKTIADEIKIKQKTPSTT